MHSMFYQVLEQRHFPHHENLYTVMTLRGLILNSVMVVGISTVTSSEPLLCYMFYSINNLQEMSKIMKQQSIF